MHSGTWAYLARRALFLVPLLLGLSLLMFLLIHAAPGDPCFELENWKRQWSDIEAEMKAIARANDIAEGHGRSD